jgi:hypothetical protein
MNAYLKKCDERIAKYTRMALKELEEGRTEAALVSIETAADWVARKEKTEESK